MMLFLLACTETKDSNPLHESSPSDDTAVDSSDSSDSSDSTDSGTTVKPGILMLAGGGTEGDDNDSTAWSARLYAHLLQGGDINGDGLISVAVLANDEETDWIPNYFVWLGADVATNVNISQRNGANEASLFEAVTQADAIFIKGGDQGEYYDAWNDTVLEDSIRSVYLNGGGIGGTSAGAMSLAQYALAGSMDLVSMDVLTDSTSTYLDDLSDGGSGIHTDFLGFLPNAFIDTHVTQRARIGRMAGVLARAVEDYGTQDIYALGMEEQTGVVIEDGIATVIGVGAVTVLHPTQAPLRHPGQPLQWEGLRLDRLTDGAEYRLSDGSLIAAPDGAELVGWSGQIGEASGDWWVDGDALIDEERFSQVIHRFPESYGLHDGSDTPVLSDALGILDAHGDSLRDDNEESIFRALYDNIGDVGFLVPQSTSMVRRDADPYQLEITPNPYVNETPAAVMVIDTSTVTQRSLSPSVSQCDAGDGSLHAAGLIGATLSILYTEMNEGKAWDMQTRSAVP